MLSIETFSQDKNILQVTKYDRKTIQQSHLEPLIMVNAVVPKARTDPPGNISILDLIKIETTPTPEI